MKEYNAKALRSLFHAGDVVDAGLVIGRLGYCLDQLGRSRAVSINDVVTSDRPSAECPMRFEELIGALVIAEAFLEDGLRAEDLEP